MQEETIKLSSGLYIADQWKNASGALLQSHNPATQELVWQGRAANEEEVNAAVEAARRTFPVWADLPIAKRVAFLKAFNEVLLHERETLVELIAIEAGKPLWEAQTEVGAVINKLNVSLQAYEQRSGLSERVINDARSVVRHKPHGVLAVLGPFNFPAHLPHGHIMPALLAGNTIVYKPSEHTPLVAEFMIRCWQKANLPAGVLNLVQGAAETGRALSKAKIDGVLFTGSHRTGIQLHQQFSAHPECMLALEMGGNNPLIVWDAEDTTAAAYHTIQSAFITAGQRCTCARRLIIADNQAGDVFLEKLLAMTKKLRVGPYTMDPEPFMGAVISSDVAKKLLQVQENLLDGGADVYLPLEQIEPETGLISPGIIDVTEMDDRGDEEYFGPLLQVIRCSDLNDALKIANETKYGLAAGIITDHEELFELFYRRIRAGIINWNRPLTGAASSAPFGGIGASGNHRPSAFYAADYCAYPVSSLLQNKCEFPDKLSPGIILE